MNAKTNNHRILVVDDNPSIHDDIRKILGGPCLEDASLQSDKEVLFGERMTYSAAAAFEIDSAYQGQRALAKIVQARAVGLPYALAFVDIRMPPGWDGAETINRLWQCDADVQVVICTAYSDYSWEDLIRKIGRSDNLVILKKPFDNIEVLQLADALTEKWRLNRKVKSQFCELDQMFSQRTCELQAANAELRAANQELQRKVAEQVQL